MGHKFDSYSLYLNQTLGFSSSGAPDQGVSKALYLDALDKNGLGLYWAKPENEWPRNQDGKITMYTPPLNLGKQLEEIYNK
jgi:catechol 2,3-dioxygenase